MTLEQFKASLTQSQPSSDLHPVVQGLWYDAKGDWNKAHSLIDSLSGKTAAAVHAYLHRVEGDTWNASYWYNKAGKRMPDISLQQEWKDLAEELLKEN